MEYVLGRPGALPAHRNRPGLTLRDHREAQRRGSGRRCGGAGKEFAARQRFGLLFAHVCSLGLIVLSMACNSWNGSPQTAAEHAHSTIRNNAQILYETGKSYTYGRPKSMRCVMFAQARHRVNWGNAWSGVTALKPGASRLFSANQPCRAGFCRFRRRRGRRHGRRRGSGRAGRRQFAAPGRRVPAQRQHQHGKPGHIGQRNMPAMSQPVPDRFRLRYILDSATPALEPNQIIEPPKPTV